MRKPIYARVGLLTAMVCVALVGAAEDGQRAGQDPPIRRGPVGRHRFQVGAHDAQKLLADPGPHQTTSTFP